MPLRVPAGPTEHLGLTQSGVSRAVQRLEQQLKVRLFERSSRAVKLTDEGRSFYESIVPPLAQLEVKQCIL